MRFIKITAFLTAVALLMSCYGFNSARKMVDPEDVTPAESYSFEKLSFDGIEKQDFYIHLEAEDSAPGNGVSVKSDKSDCSGGEYVYISDNSGFMLTVEIPSDQFYKIIVRHCADDHKENELRFNGKRVFDIYSEEGDWVDTVTDKDIAHMRLKDIEKLYDAGEISEEAYKLWNWDHIVKNGTPELSDAFTEFDMMKKVYDSEVIITRDELPKF